MTDNTFETKLQEAVEKAQQARETQHNESIAALLENPAFVEAQRSIMAKDSELKQLTATINQLNQIKPFVSKDGSKFDIKCYPNSFFGPGLGQIVGIISSSRSAFTDELGLQYSAITGISMLEFAEANEALGSPTYMTKAGEIVPATSHNLGKLKQLLASIMLKMGVKEFSPDSITQDRMDLWFTRNELAVARKHKEFTTTQEIDESSAFTIED